ncbi:MAG: GNAT family N-acetyltransferase [Acidimicrobiia bacterium]
MLDRLHLEGVWPDPVTIRRGWAKAVARPWNDEVPDATIRLERGSSDFLRATAEHLGPMGSGTVYSPALYPTAARVWSRAGFSRFGLLDVMERPLGTDSPQPEHPIEALDAPDWEEVVDLDRLAFEGFWRMSEAGLVEAMRSTPRSVVLLAHLDRRLAGYALVGAQMSVSFLQRVAVAPGHTGRGIGTSLVRASHEWALRSGARTMVLNLRPENDRARDLYEKEGFSSSRTSLELLRFEI